MLSNTAGHKLFYSAFANKGRQLAGQFALMPGASLLRQTKVIAN